MIRLDEIMRDLAETQSRLARTEDRIERMIVLGELNALNDALRFQIQLELCTHAPIPPAPQHREHVQ